tara:strand:+ start:6508 stop:6762 length:255 start_codon:yes stop_codon:yes gene_type:complete
MATKEAPVPYFPLAPQAYDQRYFSEVVRAFSVYLTQAQNPGTAVFNTLNLLNLPIHANNSAAVSGGLSVNDVYKTSTGELRIVV